MSSKSSTARWSAWAACTVAVAATIGGTGLDYAPHTTLSHIARYCQVSWRNAGIRRQEWADCTQEVLAELLHRIPDQLDSAVAANGSPEHRELKRAVWRMIKRHQRSQPHCSCHEPPAELPEPDAPLEWEDIAAAARRCLSPRQSQVLEMLRQGWQVRQIAQQLGMSPDRVSDTKYRALARLRKELGVVPEV